MLFCPKLEMWHIEAFDEIGIKKSANNIDRNYAIYPQRFYKTVQSFSQKKKFDFCFIGAFAIDEATWSRRLWIVPFIKANFGERSYLQFTDQMTKAHHLTMGTYDFTLKRQGFVPKQMPVAVRNFFDDHYFRTLCASEFTLCPGGDQNWSMRFYEALMCKSIPIMLDRTAFRTQAEAHLPYKYFVVGDTIEYHTDWAEHNYKLFLKYHTLENFDFMA